jgi:CHAT domain-containing protein
VTLLREAGWRTQLAELRAFNEVAFRDVAESLIGLYVDHPGLLKDSDLAEHTLLLAEESRWRAITTTESTSEKTAAMAETPAGTSAERLAETSVETLAESSAETSLETPAEVLARLRAVDAPILAYFVGRERSFLWLDTGQELQIHNLPGRDDLLRMLTPVTADMERPGRPIDQAAARRLSALLLGPLAGHWPAGQTLRVVPDDVLFATPWSAMPLPGDDGGEPARLIVEHGPVCEAPSLASLALSGAAASAATLRLLAVGQDAAVTVLQQQDRLPSLRHAEQEAQAVSAAWPAGNATVVVGADAVWGQLARTELPRHEVIHIASHAVVHQGVPGRSTLRLSAEGESLPVTIGTVSGLDLDAELVFLSCCEAARYGAGTGAGVVDFARAFMQAGARTIVASALRVDDEASAFLATQFYHHWLAGKNKAAALQAAQLDLRDARAVWSHPYYWAAYRLIGDGT